MPPMRVVSLDHDSVGAWALSEAEPDLQFPFNKTLDIIKCHAWRILARAKGFNCFVITILVKIQQNGLAILCYRETSGIDVAFKGLDELPTSFGIRYSLNTARILSEVVLEFASGDALGQWNGQLSHCGGSWCTSIASGLRAGSGARGCRR